MDNEGKTDKELRLQSNLPSLFLFRDPAEGSRGVLLRILKMIARIPFQRYSVIGLQECVLLTDAVADRGVRSLADFAGDGKKRQSFRERLLHLLPYSGSYAPFYLCAVLP